MHFIFLKCIPNHITWLGKALLVGVCLASPVPFFAGNDAASQAAVHPAVGAIDAPNLARVVDVAPMAFSVCERQSSDRVQRCKCVDAEPRSIPGIDGLGIQGRGELCGKCYAVPHVLDVGDVAHASDDPDESRFCRHASRYIDTACKHARQMGIDGLACETVCERTSGFVRAQFSDRTPIEGSYEPRALDRSMASVATSIVEDRHRHLELLHLIERELDHVAYSQKRSLRGDEGALGSLR